MYPQKLLAPGETIAFELKPHWRALLWPLIVLLIEVFAGVFLFMTFSNSFIRWIIFSVGIFIFVWQTLLPFARWLTTQYVFTSRRIIVRRGLLTKEGRDMPLSKVNNVSFSVSLLGRIINYGSLVVESASEDGNLVIDDVPSVENVQRSVYELHESDDVRRRDGGRGAPE
jgi:uncharacterized membrane protein YdbT with pleckstrin-like domain